MIQIKQLILIEIRTMMKIGISLFFTMIFPLVLMAIMMLSTKNPQITPEYYFIN